VTEENIESVKEAFAKSLENLAGEGRKLKSEIAELKALDEKARAVFEKFKADDVAKLEAEAEDLRKRRDVTLIEAEGDARSRINAMDGIKAEILSLESDIETGNLSPDETNELAALREAEIRLSAELTAAEADRAGAPAAIEKEKKDIEALRASVKEKHLLECALKSYVSERVKLRFADFGMLNRVSLMLCETVKTTGEIRDVFRLSYDGRPYNCLSLSERIKTGLEISALMKRLTDSDYPVFIDNGESVPVIDNVKPSGQIFVSQVVKNAPLSVRIAGETPPAKAAA
jgi:hypothetical protein